MMFYKKEETGYKVVTEGVRLKTLVHGERTLLCEFRLEKGGVFSSHKHPHEQTGYLISGRITLSMGDETFDVEPGDSWCIPLDAEHAAEVLEDSVVVEIFSPVREDYLS